MSAEPVSSGTSGLSAPPHEQLTVRRLLDEPALRHHEVLAGAEALDARLEWCLPLSEVATSTEPLERVAVYVRATPGTSLSPPAIPPLAARGAVAVLCGAETVLAPGCEQASAAAGVALVRLPATSSYQAVSRLVAEKHLAQQAHVLAYGVNVHRALGEVLYRGSGLTTMAREISRLSSCPTFLLDAQLDVIVYESLSAAAVPDPSELVRLLGVALQSDLAQDRTRTGAGAFLASLKLEQGPVTVVTAPIVLGGSTYGWVVIVELAEPPNTHDVAQHKVIAEQGAMISGSEMLRLRSVEAAEERARGDFVHALLHARFANVHELTARAAHHGFDVKAYYGAVVAEGMFDGSTPQDLERQLVLVRGVDRIQPRPGRAVLATTIGSLLVVVCQVDAGRPASGADGRPDLQRAQEQVREFALALERELRGRSERRVVVATGRVATGATGVHTSYREARVALGVAERLQLDGVAGYAELRVFAAIAELAGSADGQAFAAEILSPLANEAFGADLEEVVLTYVAHGGNLNAAARALHLHRNTMLYKIERASRLLRMDLRDPEHRFTLWLAHRIRTLAEVEASVDREFGPAV